jgi:cytochrome P450
MQINFAAIHTSSATWTHSVYTLAAKPELIAPLREEIEAILAHEDISKAALQKMDKLEAYMRENMRLDAISGGVDHDDKMWPLLTTPAVSTRRLALKPHTFSDGTYIPTGTIIGIPTTPHHTDSGIYTNANVLDPSRFERTEGAESKKYFTSIDSDASYLSFGIGKSTHVYILPSEYADRAW